MTELEKQCLYHSGIIARIDAICVKIEEKEKIADIKISEKEKGAGIKFNAMYDSIQIAKQEMDRRLDGMNHLQSQLNEQREENQKKISELVNLTLSRREFYLEIDKRDTRLLLLEKGKSEKEGSKKWSDHIITVLIASAMVLLIHFLFKF